MRDVAQLALTERDPRRDRPLDGGKIVRVPHRQRNDAVCFVRRRRRGSRGPKGKVRAGHGLAIRSHRDRPPAIRCGRIESFEHRAVDKAPVGLGSFLQPGPCLERIGRVVLAERRLVAVHQPRRAGPGGRPRDDSHAGPIDRRDDRDVFDRHPDRAGLGRLRQEHEIRDPKATLAADRAQLDPLAAAELARFGQPVQPSAVIVLARRRQSQELAVDKKPQPLVVPVVVHHKTDMVDASPRRGGPGGAARADELEMRPAMRRLQVHLKTVALQRIVGHDDHARRNQCGVQQVFAERGRHVVVLYVIHRSDPLWTVRHGHVGDGHFSRRIAHGRRRILRGCRRMAQHVQTVTDAMCIAPQRQIGRHQHRVAHDRMPDRRAGRLNPVDRKHAGRALIAADGQHVLGAGHAAGGRSLAARRVRVVRVHIQMQHGVF